jgi:hypothetical protein
MNLPVKKREKFKININNKLINMNCIPEKNITSNFNWLKTSFSKFAKGAGEFSYATV